MNIEEMKKKRRELGYSYSQLSELSGVPVGTIQKIFGGITASPRHKTLVALERVLNPGTGAENAGDGWSYDRVRAEESAEPYHYKKQGEYTVEDYLAWPEDQRIELIDGVIYDMASPRIIHQAIIGELFVQLRDCMRKNHPDCRVLLSPVDVQLDRDDKTMLIPDLVILCGDENLIPERVFGAPDFVIEVLSPSTRKKDMVIKLKKYQEAGVKEYWLVDPKTRRVMVYDFESDIDVELFTFDDHIPVGISGGTCEVDFTVIKAAVEGLPG